MPARGDTGLRGSGESADPLNQKRRRQSAYTGPGLGTGQRLADGVMPEGSTRDLSRLRRGIGRRRGMR